MANVKIVLLGEGGVGKTSIKRIFTGQSINLTHTATIGADFVIKDFNYYPVQGSQPVRIKFMIYDLAGQKRFSTVRGNFITGAHAAIFVYDITNRGSFEALKDWLIEFKSVIRTKVPLILVANKIDLRKNDPGTFITTEEGQKMAEKLSGNFGYGKTNKFYFIEASALENVHINDIFDHIAHEVYEFYIRDNRLAM